MDSIGTVNKEGDADPLVCFYLQEFLDQSTGVGGRCGVLSPSSLSVSQSSEILGWVREAAQAKAGCSQNACGMEDVLQLLRILYIIGSDSVSNPRTLQEGTTATHSRLPAGWVI